MSEVNDFQLDQAQDLGTQKVTVSYDDDGEPKEGFVIVSKDSEQYQQVQALHRQRAIRRQAVKRTRFDLKSEEGAEQLDDTLRKNEHETAVAVTVDWFGWTIKGEPAPFNKEHLSQLLKLRPSYRDRILGALEDEAGFLKQSPKTSSGSQKQQPEAQKGAKTA